MAIRTEFNALEPDTGAVLRKRERDAVLLAAGIRPARSAKPRPDFTPVRTRLTLRRILHRIFS
jgi:hypothetical protein